MTNIIAIVGIHTNIGKTIASAVLAEAMDAHYWKPVQAGDLENRDSLVVKRLISNGENRVHKEALLLSQPMSPHAAAAIDGIEIDHTKFELPATDKTLLLETAGGILSPLSNTMTMADMVQYYRLPTILVVQNYLGSINHTLLSIEVLSSRGIPLLGVVINGESNTASETYIEQYGKASIIARIPAMEDINPVTVKQCADKIKDSLLQSLTDAQHTGTR